MVIVISLSAGLADVPAEGSATSVEALAEAEGEAEVLALELEHPVNISSSAVKSAAAKIVFFICYPPLSKKSNIYYNTAV